MISYTTYTAEITQFQIWSKKDLDGGGDNSLYGLNESTIWKEASG